MTDPVSRFIPAPPNSLLDLSLNIHSNPETTVHDDMYNAKYRQPDHLYEPVLFEPLNQFRVSHTMFKVMSYVDFGLYLKSFCSLESIPDDYKNNSQA